MADVIITTLRLQGQSQYIAGLRQATGAVGGLGAATDSARVSGQAFGRSLDRVGRGITRWSGRAITAFSAVAGASGLMGIKFNASMEQSLIAFESFLGSGRKARKMVGDLVTLAAKTPFEIQGLLQASTAMLSAGLEGDKLVPTMKNVGDAVAAAGRGSESIDRMGYALQQVLTAGRLTGNELRQMSEAGVPAMKLMAEGAGLTGEQFRDQVEKGAISANEALEFLNRGIEQNERISGLAEKQAKSLAGQWSTAKDNFRILTGVLTKDTSSWLSGTALPAINDFLTRTTWALGETTMTAQQKFSHIRQLARIYLAPLGQDIGRAIERARIGDKLTVGLERAIPVIAETAGRASGRAAAAFIRGWMQADVWGKIFVAGVILGKLGVFNRIGRKVADMMIGAMAARWAGSAAQLKFKNMGKASGKWIGRGLVIGIVAGLVLMFPEIKKKIDEKFEPLIDDLIKEFESIPGRAAGKVGDLFGKIIPNIPTPSLPFRIPGGQTGGRVGGRDGWRIVGERGPEMVRLPTGASIYPHGSMQPAALGAGLSGAIKLRTEVPVFLDGKVITRVVGHHTANDVARTPHGSGFSARR